MTKPITARDLCNALGGTDYNDEYQGGQFVLETIRITAVTGYGAKTGKLTLRAHAADQELTQRVWKEAKHIEFPTINLDPSRDLAAILKDVQTRLIAKAVPQVVELRKIDRAIIERTESIAAQAHRLAYELPAYDVTANQEGQNINIRLRSTDERPHLSGYIKPNGEFVLTTVGTLSPEKARAFLALLAS